MTQKTPYEIRTDLLRLAFDVLSLRNLNLASGEQPKQFTTEEMIVEAEKLNRFVSMPAFKPANK